MLEKQANSILCQAFTNNIDAKVLGGSKPLTLYYLVRPGEPTLTNVSVGSRSANLVLEKQIQMHCAGDNKVTLLTKIEVRDLELKSIRVKSQQC
jgi:hypothetical protein